MIDRFLSLLSVFLIGGCDPLQAQDHLQELRRLPQHADHVLATFRSKREGVPPLRYYLFAPPQAPDAGKDVKFPLVVVLHHAGAERDLGSVLTVNPESIGRWLEPGHPCYVLVPWSGGRHWESGEWKTVTPMSERPSPNAAAVLDLTDGLCRKMSIDPNRIYLVGQSMGAFGVWDLAARRPEFFAAAIAVCGGGDPAQAEHLKDLPIWAFHGDADEIIPVERTREMAEALTALGASRFTYTEYEGASHDKCSEQAFTEPGLATWLFEQRKFPKNEALIHHSGE